MALFFVGSMSIISSCGGSSSGEGKVGTWAAISNVNAPDGLRGRTAIWTGSKMIAWGGKANGFNFATNTGGIYDPGSNSWVQTSTVGVSAKQYHSAIWTGSKMIVWGGWDSSTSNPTNTGAIFDPVNDGWAGISTVGSPSARYSANAFWTGSRMIIWGGVDSGGSLLNTGGIYDPNTNSWTAINTTNAPQSRRGASVIWTGNDMVVWGGRASTTDYTALTSAAKYNPNTNTWSSIDLSSAPISSRWGHSTTWTGSTMIVLGGANVASCNAPDTQPVGALFNPLQNTWNIIAKQEMCGYGGDSEYYGVWTGSKVINLYYNSGRGRIYDTSSGESQTMTAITDILNIAGFPTSEYPSPIWTGSKMLIWGTGFNGNLPYAAGATYTP